MKAERIWIDLETTGLVQDIDYILEFAVGITDKFGNWIDSRSWILPAHPSYRAKVAAINRAKADSFVGPMHTESGLWKALDDADPMGEIQAESLILDYLLGYGFQEPMPMCGSSVHFDRKFIFKHMPQLHDWFLHRDIDNSSTKEQCRDLAPNVYARLKEETKPQKLHRGVPDLMDTVDEYRFYLENFLRVER